MTETNAGHGTSQRSTLDPGAPSQEEASRGGQAGGSDVNAEKAVDAHKEPHPAHSQLDTNGQIPAAAAAPAGQPGDQARTEEANARAAASSPTGKTAEGTVINRPSDPSRPGSDTASPAPSTSGEAMGQKHQAGSALVERPRGVIPGDELDSPLAAATATDDDVVDADLDPMELTNLNAGIADTHTQRRAALAAQTRPSTRVQAIPALNRDLSAYEAWLEGKWRSLRGYQQELTNRLTGLGVAVPDEPYYEDFKG